MRLLERTPAWRGVLVLNYHRIGEPGRSPLDRGLFSATPEQLDEQLGYLARHADVIALEEVPARLGARGRHIVLTFDDGYRDNHEHALPVLRSHGLHATFFLATGFLDRPALPWWDDAAWLLRSATADRIPAAHGLPSDVPLATPADRERAISTVVETYKRLPAGHADDLLAHVRATAAAPAGDARELWMTWDMVRELRDAGMGIGGHTVSHPVLASVDDERVAWELETCAERLRDELGIDMRLFAYPVGRPEAYDGRSVGQLERMGVEIACAFDGGHAAPDRTDLLRLPRTSVSADMSLAFLRLRMALPQRFARW